MSSYEPEPQKVVAPGEVMANLVEMLGVAAAHAADIAHAKKALFDAYVAEGFTKEQALDLVKGTGVY